MMTEPAFDALDGFFEQDAEHRSEELDGIGTVPTRVVYPDQLQSIVEQFASPDSHRSPIAALAWKLRMQTRTFFTAYRNRTED